MFYICLHNTYHSVEVALYSTDSILGKISISKERASGYLITQIDKLLISKFLKISDITCLIVNQGPAPFTTLRTMIATVNGISFATNIPIVGVNGLTALIQEHKNGTQLPTVALLNAFNKAVYYAIQTDSLSQPIIGYDSITTLLGSLKAQFPTTRIRFMGNGSTLYQSDIKEMLGDQAFFLEPLPQVASIEFIFKEGLQLWKQKQHIYHQLEPLYLKKPLS